jgi:hypothetical protein
MSPLHPSLLAAVLCTLAFNCAPEMVAQDVLSRDSAQTADRESTVQAQADGLPDSPGATLAQSQNSAQQAPQTSPTIPQSDSQPPDKTKSPNTDQKEEKLQRPVGTAAAEAPKVSGITAAQPAGAAIAPAKQRRVRTMVLKVGAILAAGAAVGTVVALTAATPSKPPGAH